MAYVMRMDHYKHSQDEQKWIRFRSRDGPLCPVKSLWKYLNMRGSQDGVVFISQTGKPIRAAWFTEQLRYLLQMEGLCAARYAPHSLRIGATRELAGEGASTKQICAFGRWKTQAYKKYIKHNVLVV